MRDPDGKAFDLNKLEPEARNAVSNCFLLAMQLSALAQKCKKEYGIKLVFLSTVADEQPPGKPNNKVYITDIEVHIDPKGLTDAK